MTRTFVPRNGTTLWRTLRDNFSQAPYAIRNAVALGSADRMFLESGTVGSLPEGRQELLLKFAVAPAQHISDDGEFRLLFTQETEVQPPMGIEVESGLGWSMWLIDGHLSTRELREFPLNDRVTWGYRPEGSWRDGDAPAGTAGFVFTDLDGWGEGFVAVRPTDEMLEGLPQQVRQMAYRAMPRAAVRDGVVITEADDGTLTMGTRPVDLGFTVDDMIATARTAWRERVLARMRTPMDDGFAQRRAEHRAKTQQNWSAFLRARPKAEEQLVGTLPFVPHGLASSRRWGIEVESGGARGVDCPPSWNVHGDGSLRSAYDGYVEVQDFEPYDREEGYLVSWVDCDSNHNPRTEVYDEVRGEYLWLPNESYIDPRHCASCGPRTRTVRVEPQTIHHHPQAGDCREFVSPILTSMHSNGLEKLCEALSKNPQNSSAGVHVHVEASDLNSKQIATLVYGYGILEPILEASYRRERRDFCQARPHDDLLQAGRIASRGGDFNADSGNRYVTVNTHSLSNHGTIEFRAMGPVYEYEYLVRWAMLCRELVNTVAAGATNRDFAKVKSWQDLLNLITMFGKEYVRASVYEMTGEVGEVAKLEKAGEPVTNEALNADLASAFDSLRATFRRLNPRIEHAVESISRRLVTVGGTVET